MNGTLFFRANDGTNGVELWTVAPDADAVPPTADIVDVTPDPLTEPNAGTVTINFSEAVTGVDIDDFSLTLTTVATGTQTVDLSDLTVGGGGDTYTIDLSSVSDVEGVYELTLNASGSDIQDLAGNDLTEDAADDWVLLTAIAGVDGDGNLTFTDTGDPTDNEVTITQGTGSAGGPFDGASIFAWYQKP